MRYESVSGLKVTQALLLINPILPWLVYGTDSLLIHSSTVQTIIKIKCPEIINTKCAKQNITLDCK